MEYNGCRSGTIPTAELLPIRPSGCWGWTAVAEALSKTAAELDRRELARSLYCRQCGYNLRGLRLGGQCPECGLEVWQSAVDPAASRLPRLHDPRGVGDAIVWLMTCLLLATLLMLARPVALRVDDILALSGPEALSLLTPTWLMVIAGFVTLLGLWSVWKLAPARREDSLVAVRGGLRLLTIGLLAMGTLAALAGLLIPAARSATGPERLLMQAVGHVLTVGGLVVTMLGLRRVLRVIGERSREYRTARAGRQRARDMIAAAIGLGVGELLRLLGLALELVVLRTFGTVVMWISTLMLVIGLFYLLANALWIGRSLRRPPPTLQELLEGEVQEEGAEAGEPGQADDPAAG